MIGGLTAMQEGTFSGLRELSPKNETFPVYTLPLELEFRNMRNILFLI